MNVEILLSLFLVLTIVGFFVYLTFDFNSKKESYEYPTQRVITDPVARQKFIDSIDNWEDFSNAEQDEILVGNGYVEINGTSVDRSI